MPSLDLLELVLEETREEWANFEKVYRRLKACERGSEEYFECFGELAAALTILKTKADSGERVTDQIIDAMPD